MLDDFQWNAILPYQFPSSRAVYRSRIATCNFARNIYPRLIAFHGFLFVNFQRFTEQSVLHFAFSKRGVVRRERERERSRWITIVHRLNDWRRRVTVSCCIQVSAETMAEWFGRVYNFPRVKCRSFVIVQSS